MDTKAWKSYVTCPRSQFSKDHIQCKAFNHCPTPPCTGLMAMLHETRMTGHLGRWLIVLRRFSQTVSFSQLLPQSTVSLNSKNFNSNHICSKQAYSSELDLKFYISVSSCFWPKSLVLRLIDWTSFPLESSLFLHILKAKTQLLFTFKTATYHLGAIDKLIPVPRCQALQNTNSFSSHKHLRG